MSGWWFGSFLIFHILWIIIPTDQIIFFRGVGQPPDVIVTVHPCDSDVCSQAATCFGASQRMTVRFRRSKPREGFPTFSTSDLAMDQYLYIPFLGGWTSIYQLFDVHQGYKVLTHCHLIPFLLPTVKTMGSFSPLDEDEYLLMDIEISGSWWKHLHLWLWGNLTPPKDQQLTSNMSNLALEFSVWRQFHKKGPPDACWFITHYNWSSYIKLGLVICLLYQQKNISEHDHHT